MSYIVKPFQKSDLIPAIELSLGRHAEMRSLEAEVGDLEERLEARKIIDRAKGVLMDRYDMSESQSWQFIRTEAMNRRTKVHEIAGQVVAGDLAPSDAA
jgi:response regulator NasT